MVEKIVYEVIITKPAMFRLQKEVLEYIGKNFSFTRGIEIEAELLKTVKSLGNNPQRAPIESSINFRSKKIRYLLFKETAILELKIHFFIVEDSKQVYITDFFPTRMNPSKMKK